MKLIQKFLHLIRKHDGDKVERHRFRGDAWSALRILRVIAMESEDNDEMDVAAEKAEAIATHISDWLKVIARTGNAHSLRDQRLHGCRKYVELGRLALLFGEKFCVPLIDGRYSGTGPSERAMLRTFFLSQARECVVTLEFEPLTERTERKKSAGQTRKVIIELHDK